jgi:hypothetical protein
MSTKRERIAALLAGACLTTCGARAARAIGGGQLDTFSDGTTASWGSGDQVQVVTSGGPAGAGDEYLQFTSMGGSGPGSKLAVNNLNQWSGDYTSAGVTSISMDMLNSNSSPPSLSMRVVLFGSSGSRWTSTVADLVPADNHWHHEVFSLLQQDLTEVQSGDTYDQLMAAVTTLQIRYDATNPPSAGGTTYVGSMGVDNITAIVPPPPTVAWLGGAGNWSDGTKWQGGASPNNPSLIAQIDNGNAAASSVTLDTSATVNTVALDADDSLTIGNGQTLTLAGPGASAFNGTLAFAGSGKIDLGANQLSLATDIATAEGYIENGHIISTASGGAVGYKDLGSGAIEVRFTLLGDSDLDGTVNVADLANLAGNFGKTSGQFWINGDFDYNGNVNVADLADLAGNFGKTLGGGGAGGSIAMPDGIAASASTSEPVPDPESLSVAFAIAGLCTMLRRPRRRRAGQASLPNTFGRQKGGGRGADGDQCSGIIDGVVVSIVVGAARRRVRFALAQSAHSVFGALRTSSSSSRRVCSS